MIMIQTLISKYEKIKPNTEKKEEVYNQILKELNSLEKVYIILSNQDDTSKYRKPFVADKDGKPVIFLFTEYEHALNWVNHYEGFKYKNTPLIGELYRAQNEFNSIFQICDYMGIKEILLNEGLCLFFIAFSLSSSLPYVPSHINKSLPEIKSIIPSLGLLSVI